MEQLSIPIYTLKEIIEDKGISLNNTDVLVFDMNKDDFCKIDCNYPSRVICMGIMMLTQGMATVNIDHQEVVLKTGDVLYMFPNNVLEFKAFSADCSIKSVLIAPDFMSSLNFQVESQEALEMLSSNYSKIIGLDEGIFSVISYHIDKLRDLNNPETVHFFSVEMIKMHLTLLIYELANYSRNQSQQQNLLSYRKEDIAIQFVNLVGSCFRNHKDVQHYADALHISRKHLSRTIKEVLELTPKQIIENKIITEAKMLLLKSKLNINQVIAELQFEDQAVFSKLFKKNTGFTPSAYRKQLFKFPGRVARSLRNVVE